MGRRAQRRLGEVQGERLDRGYLRRWAVQLKVSDLLERALEQA